MTTTTFADLGLSAKVTAAVEAAGYTTPTPIQAQAIPVAVTGRDILGIAQTGTGKTAAFTMPMISRLESGRARARMPRSLILAPTRELAAQVAQSFEKYGVNHKLTVALLIGGVSMDDQVAKLDRGVDVLIATPGRLLDHFGRGRVMLMGVEILVIDEADRMLDMGFIPDIEKICKLLPPRRQTLFFSATMPPEITRLSEAFLKDPVRIEVARPATTAKTITQQFYFCRGTEDWEKREVLRDLIRGEQIKNAIIFCNRKRDVAILHKSLTKHGFNAGALHGDMDQSSRTATLDKFRNGELMLLAASDVAARGLDIPDVSHVFNFDVPWQADDYVHRIGRTGRAGREGKSLSLVAPEDLKSVGVISKLIGEEPTWINEPPTPEEIADSGKRRRGRGGRGGDRGGREASGGDRGRGRSGGDRGRERSSDRGGRPRPDGGRNRDRPIAAEGRDKPMAAEGREAREDIVETIGGEAAGDHSPRMREDGGRGNRPRRDRGRERDRPARAGEPGAEQPFEARGERPRDDRPPRAERPREDRPRDERPRDERPRDTRPRDDRPRGDRPRRDDGERPAGRTEQRADRAPRHEPAEAAPRRERQAPRPQRQPQAENTNGGGFADNVPAFLKRPVR